MADGPCCRPALAAAGRRDMARRDPGAARLHRQPRRLGNSGARVCRAPATRCCARPARLRRHRRRAAAGPAPRGWWTMHSGHAGAAAAPLSRPAPDCDGREHGRRRRRCAGRPAGAITPDATVLLAPAVWGWDQMDPFLRGLARVAEQCRAALGAGSRPQWRPNIVASDNIAALLRFGRDPLTLRAHPRRTCCAGWWISWPRRRTRTHRAARTGADPGRPPRPDRAAGRDRSGLGKAAASRAPRLLSARLPSAAARHRSRAGEADILAWLRDPDAWLPSGADAAAAAWRADHAWEAGVVRWLRRRPVGRRLAAPGLAVLSAAIAAAPGIWVSRPGGTRSSAG